MNWSVMTGVMSCMRATGREDETSAYRRGAWEDVYSSEDEEHNGPQRLYRNMIIHYDEIKEMSEWSRKYDRMK